MNSANNTRRWLSIACSSLILGGAIVAPMTPALSYETPLISLTPKLPEPASSVIAAIREDLGQRYGVSNIQVVSATEQMWPDGCLGLPRGKEACTMAIVPGWRIEVTDGRQTWVYRTDKTGRTLRLENEGKAGLDSQTASKLLRQVARDTRISVRNLKIAEVKPANFDGCLGIYRPNQACTKILIRGYQAIVTSPARSYVYHLSQDASRIAQNDTASGAGSKIRVSFESLMLNGSPEVEPNVVFRSSTSGDLTGRMTTITLTDDGKVTEFTTAPNIRSRPIGRKTLTKEQLATFQQALQNRRFRNFNGLSYLTEAALADYPTTTYQSADSTVQFIDLEKPSLPRSLRNVIRTWETLIQP
jgi:hypothetical protein